MPRKRNGSEPDDATLQSNIGNRRDEITSGLKRLYALDCEIAALTEEHLKDLRAEKSDIKKSLRERFNLPATVVQARYYSYRIERDAERTNDGITLDAIRELHEALPIGGQANFLGPIGAPKFEDDVPAQADAFEQGRTAGMKGSNLATCPYPAARKKLKAEWERGWQAGQEHLAGKLEGPRPAAS